MLFFFNRLPLYLSLCFHLGEVLIFTPLASKGYFVNLVTCCKVLYTRLNSIHHRFVLLLVAVARLVCPLHLLSEETHSGPVQLRPAASHGEGQMLHKCLQWRNLFMQGREHTSWMIIKHKMPSAFLCRGYIFLPVSAWVLSRCSDFLPREQKHACRGKFGKLSYYP